MNQIIPKLCSSVADPDPNQDPDPPDPRVFGPPGSRSGSISQSYGSNPGLDPSIIKVNDESRRIRIRIHTKMSWIRKDNNMKNEDEDDFFWIEAKKNEYIRTSTGKEQRKTNYSFLNYQGTKTNQCICSSTIQGIKKN
jgi:hypothetical protein